MPVRVDAYGEIAVYEDGVIPTDHVDRIHGFRIGRSPEGEPLGIELQLDAGDHRRHLTIPILEVMALLSFLKAFQLNEDLPFPEDPRDPNWKASDYRSTKSG